MSKPEPQLLCVGEVALALRCSPKSVYRLVGAGILPAVRLGVGEKAPIRIDRTELDQWLFSVPADGHRKEP